MAMNKTIKKKWLKALREGGYRQTRLGRLKTQRGYCCLGVLCEVVDPQIKWQADEAEPNRFRPYPGASSEFPPDTISNQAGLGRERFNQLSRMNDNGHYNFKRIADWIEEHL